MKKPLIDFSTDWRADWLHSKVMRSAKSIGGWFWFFLVLPVRYIRFLIRRWWHEYAIAQMWRSKGNSEEALRILIEHALGRRYKPQLRKRFGGQQAGFFEENKKEDT